MDFMTRILETGVSGMFGGEVARQLMAKSIPIRVLVRDPSKVQQLDKSVEIITGDFMNTEALATALNGIEKLYLASYDKPELVEHQANVLAVAKQCEVQHVVRLSSAGTEENNELPDLYRHAVCERQLEETSLGFTHLKPMWVMQNFESFVVNDRIRLPAGEGRLGLVDHRDVAAVAVAALTDLGHEGKAYELATESLSHSEVADQLSQATGRSITYENISPEAYEKQLLVNGYLQDDVDTLQGLLADVRNGVNRDTNVTDTVRDVLGRPGITFKQFAQDYASCIGSSS
jgi:uncharacterized protein YbjT (DUF2867 family)